MKLRSLFVILAAAIVAVIVYSVENGQAVSSRYFSGLGDLGGGRFYSAPTGVSADGTVVVGYSHSAAGFEAFRWMPAEGIVGLGFAHASAVSSDGSTVVGYRLVDGRADPVKWSASGGVESLDSHARYRNGAACGVSPNGTVIVGAVGTHDADAGGRDTAFRWTAADGITSFAPFDADSMMTEAHAVSADGAVVVGTRRSPAGHDEACRWTAESGPVGLGFLPGHCTSAAYAASADGSVVVGRSSDYITSEAFRWTTKTGMISLGTLLKKNRSSAAQSVSADGSVIVGYSETESGWEAFVWDAAHRMRSIRQVLEGEFNLADALRGWKLRSAQAVSADGSVVVGFGLNRSGNQEAWLARIARPSALPSRLLPNNSLLVVDRRSSLRTQRGHSRIKKDEVQGFSGMTD